MPSEKSARSSERKRERNRSVRSSVRTYVAATNNAIDGGNKEQSESAIARAIQALDKAAKRGVIHSNNAARRKSRLMRKFNSLLTKG